MITGSGQIEFNEFIRMMGKANKEQDLREAFKVFDKNGDGKISKMELKTVLESLGQHLTDRELDDMMHEADTNQDGEVDFEGMTSLLCYIISLTCPLRGHIFLRVSGI